MTENPDPALHIPRTAHQTWLGTSTQERQHGDRALPRHRCPDGRSPKDAAAVVITASGRGRKFIIVHAMDCPTSDSALGSALVGIPTGHVGSTRPPGFVSPARRAVPSRSGFTQPEIERKYDVPAGTPLPTWPTSRGCWSARPSSTCLRRRTSTPRTSRWPGLVSRCGGAPAATTRDGTSRPRRLSPMSAPNAAGPGGADRAVAAA